MRGTVDVTCVCVDMLMEYVPPSQSYLEDPSIITSTSQARKQKKIAEKLRHLFRVTDQVAVHKADLEL